VRVVVAAVAHRVITRSGHLVAVLVDRPCVDLEPRHSVTLVDQVRPACAGS
jgi:hypothetical protein